MTRLQKTSALMALVCLILPAMLWASDDAELASVELIEVLEENEGKTHRLRYLDAAIPDARVDDVLDEMAKLCNAYLGHHQLPHPDTIIVSMSDRLVEFGVTDSEATQFFEVYAVENATCMWEVF